MSFEVQEREEDEEKNYEWFSKTTEDKPQLHISYSKQGIERWRFMIADILKISQQ